MADSADTEYFLPLETWIRVFGYLDGFTLVSVIKTCKLWKETADDPEIWGKVFKSYAKITELTHHLLPPTSELFCSLFDNDESAESVQLDDFEADVKQFMSKMDSLSSVDESPSYESLRGDPKFVAFFNKLVESSPDIARVIQSDPDFVARFYVSLMSQKDKPITEVKDWKRVYKHVSRCIIVNADMAEASSGQKILVGDVTNHTPVTRAGNRQIVFGSLREAIAAALPFDTIYVQKSQEEVDFPLELKPKAFISRPILNAALNLFESYFLPAEGQDKIQNLLPRVKQAGEISKMIYPDERYIMPVVGRYLHLDKPGTNASSSASSSQAETKQDPILALDTDANKPKDLKPVLPYVIVPPHLHDLTIFGKGGGSFQEDIPVACIVTPVVWMAKNGLMATFDVARGGFYITKDASLKLIDANIEVRTFLRKEGSLHILDSNIHQMPDDRSFLTLPHDSLDFDLTLEKVEIAAILGTAEKKALYGKLISYPIALQFDSDLPKEEISQKRKKYLDTILNLLDQDVFEMAGYSDRSEPPFGTLIRRQLLSWIPSFPDDKNLILVALASVRSVSEEKIQDTIAEEGIHMVALNILTHHLHDDELSFAALEVVAKLLWSSDTITRMIGTQQQFWDQVTTINKKCRGLLSSDLKELDPATGLPLSALSSNLAESAEVVPVKPQYSSCYKSFNQVRKLLEMCWSFASYPETSVFVFNTQMDFVIWAAQEFPSASGIMASVCGIGQALLDCLPANTDLRVKCTQFYIKNGGVKIALSAMKKLSTVSEIFQNGDIWLYMMFRLCPEEMMKEFISHNGTSTLLSAAVSSVASKEPQLDWNSTLSYVAKFDSEWQLIRAKIDDEMFTTNPAERKLAPLATIFRSAVVHPARRFELVSMGCLTFLQSVMLMAGQDLIALNFIDALDYISREQSLLQSHAEQIRDAALHLLSTATSIDCIAWLHTIIERTKPFTAQGEPTEITPPKLAARMESADPEHAHSVKISSDGLTLRVVDNSFHSFIAELPQGYLTSGKWCYEVHIHSDGPMQIGWATKDFKPSHEENLGCGDDDQSWAVDFCRMIMWHKGIHPLSNFRSIDPQMSTWTRGDILICMADLDKRTLTFRLAYEDKVVFEDVDFGSGIVPAVTLARGESVTINFGVLPLVLPYNTKKYQRIDGPESFTQEQIVSRRVELGHDEGQWMEGGEFEELDGLEELENDDGGQEDFDFDELDELGEEDDEGDEDDEEDDEDGSDNEDDPDWDGEDNLDANMGNLMGMFGRRARGRYN